MLVVTSGDVYTDLDVLACAIAYGDILNKTHRPALVYLPGPLNESITSSMRNWDFKYQTKLEPGDYQYVIVDVSDPDHISRVVDPTKISKIYDHHFGHEDYWRSRIGDGAHIEPVGACATLIWEEAVKKGATLSQISVNLLYTAIFSNTLNFNASVTHDRDKRAFAQLGKLVDLPPNWPEIYYSELEADVFANPSEAIVKDIKTTVLSKFPHPFIIGQLELWNSQKFLVNHMGTIKEALQAPGNPYWFFTSPSISDGHNYLYTENPGLKDLLTRLIGAKFTGDLGTTDKLYLRKEILKKLQEYK